MQKNFSFLEAAKDYILKNSKNAFDFFVLYIISQKYCTAKKQKYPYFFA